MADSTIQRTFAGGELAPALAARADLVKYVTGLRRCRNFIILRSGGVANRAGTKLVAPCKTESILVQLHRYVSEIAGESLLIESGQGYMRFYKNGGAVMVDNAVVEITHPFMAGWNRVQSGPVITMTCPYGTVPPHELICVGPIEDWVLQPVSTAPAIAAPTGLVGVAGSSGTLTYAYQVTAASERYEESLSAGVAIIPDCDLPTIQDPHVLTWTPIAGAVEYYLYCDPFNNGTFGFIGTATVTPETVDAPTFNDAGFIPDFAVTPPILNEPFKTAGNYPKRAGYHQQRRLFANTDNQPDAIWGSRVGFTSNFSISSPLQDDDAISLKIAGNQHNPVRHLVGLKSLITLTDSGVWVVGAPMQALTPSALFADQDTYVAVNADVEPVVIGNAILYVQARGAIVRDLRFDQEVEGLAGRDLTLFASHLFDGYTILTMDYQQTPHSTVWACRSDGTLLGLTYLREQEVWGWHRHDTALAGRFEHVCVVPEHGEDVVYLIVRRNLGTDAAPDYRRFIERLESREIMNYPADAYFVDCGLSYSGDPARTFSGLDHLEGQKVAVLADSTVLSNGWDAQSLVVANGEVTLPPPPAPAVGWRHVHIGLAIVSAELETLDLDAEAQSVIRDRKKSIKGFTLLVDRTTKSFYSGPDFEKLMPYKLNPFESQSREYSGPMEQALTTEYNDVGRIVIQLREPVPFTLLGILPNVELGG